MISCEKEFGQASNITVGKMPGITGTIVGTLYRGFEIRKVPVYLDGIRGYHYKVFKGGNQFSMMALISEKAARTVIDTYLNKNKPCMI